MCWGDVMGLLCSLGPSLWFNDIEPYVCEWLKNLYPEAAVIQGDFRDIGIEQGYTRYHFFAGIGGWEYALQLAGWPDDVPVWTASLPCQPFSTAGKRKGILDDRHLWPGFYEIIKESRPNYIFGEQVASKDGRAWLAGIQTDLERIGYTFGAADICAAGVAAPHIRQRLYWVAYTQRNASQSWRLASQFREGIAAQGAGPSTELGRCSDVGGLGNSDSTRQGWSGQLGERAHQLTPWQASSSIYCLDGHYRRIPSEPSLFPVADGVSARVHRIRAAGGSIVPQVATQFIGAFMEAVS